VFVPDGSSSTGVLEVIYAVSIYLGVPGQVRDRMKPFASLGDDTRVDIATVAFDQEQLAVMEDVIVPGTIERVLQLLAEKATDANVHGTKARSMAFIPFEMMERVLESRMALH
jgi:UDP-N-acetyl-D-mannosaminuronate dehydrogenase